jgi:hypothetical protein
MSNSIETQTYDGFSNYETRSVALTIKKYEDLYLVAEGCECYDDLITYLWDCNCFETPDGVRWDDKKVNSDEIESFLSGL